jgi:hypothetical protein
LNFFKAKKLMKFLLPLCQQSALPIDLPVFAMQNCNSCLKTNAKAKQEISAVAEERPIAHST